MFTTKMATTIPLTCCSRSSTDSMLSHLKRLNDAFLGSKLPSPGFFFRARKTSNAPTPKITHTMPSRNRSSAPTAAVTNGVQGRRGKQAGCEGDGQVVSSSCCGPTSALGSNPDGTKTVRTYAVLLHKK